MNLSEFLSRYDKAKSIILLEGKRTVDEQDKSALIALGKLLATNSDNIIFRSGNAIGADELFSAGVVLVDGNRLQLILPYNGHRRNASVGIKSFSLDSINLENEPEVVAQSRTNVKMVKLIDSFILGQRDRHVIKAAYIIRDTVKVIGTRTIAPCSFGIFYDDLGSPMVGGTGHTMKICMQNNIPYIDQRVWMKWLE